MSEGLYVQYSLNPELVVKLHTGDVLMVLHREVPPDEDWEAWGEGDTGWCLCGNCVPMPTEREESVW